MAAIGGIAVQAWSEGAVQLSQKRIQISSRTGVNECDIKQIGVRGKRFSLVGEFDDLTAGFRASRQIALANLSGGLPVTIVNNAGIVWFVVAVIDMNILEEDFIYNAVGGLVGGNYWMRVQFTLQPTATFY